MLDIDVVQTHLVSYWICQGYQRWSFPRESSSRKTSNKTSNTYVQENSNENRNTLEMFHHMFPMHDMVPEHMEEDMVLDPMVGGPSVEQPPQGPNDDALQFLKLLKDVQELCYEGCDRPQTE